ncbi:hypothetical protein BN961_00660 [Afipia felis]|uniref:Transposase n=1 Tax=Afipia felis TaxID=1035 RepID=A0A090N6Q7_AFIFE|nr:hypothetical protein BN961_00660 [Afipia felis]
MLRQPLFRRRIGQGLDAPRRGVHLLGSLQRIAAVDEQSRIADRHHRKPGRTGEAAQPGEALLGGRNVFVLLTVAAWNNEPGQTSLHDFLAESRQPRRKRGASFRFVEILKLGLEHQQPSKRSLARTMLCKLTRLKRKASAGTIDGICAFHSLTGEVSAWKYSTGQGG